MRTQPKSPVRLIGRAAPGVRRPCPGRLLSLAALGRFSGETPLLPGGSYQAPRFGTMAPPTAPTTKGAAALRPTRAERLLPPVLRFDPLWPRAAMAVVDWPGRATGPAPRVACPPSKILRTA